jgi:hypothetical protein
MSKFIVKDDIWGVRQAVRILWNKRCLSGYNWGRHSRIDKEIEFDAFYNQQIPEAWRETLATVKRHAEDIDAVASNSQFQGLVWFKRNGQFNSGYLNQQLADEIRKGGLELPTYIEIEEEKQKWQSHPQYNEERGFSEPIREELIQIRIHK